MMHPRKIQTLFESLLRRLPVYSALLAERDKALMLHSSAEAARAAAEEKLASATQTILDLVRDKDEVFKRWLDWQAKLSRLPTIFYAAQNYPDPERQSPVVARRKPTADQMMAEMNAEFEAHLARIRQEINAE